MAMGADIVMPVGGRAVSFVWWMTTLSLNTLPTVLGTCPEVEAVTLGGSRAEGTHRPNSDWDFGIYYRGDFDPQTVRDIGWPGEVSEIGAWGGGVFNGGAWLEIDRRRSDLHYRDLDTIDREIAAAQEGRFRIEPLMFHLAGTRRTWCSRS
jgi:predicted nucleotidyltransferase